MCLLVCVFWERVVFVKWGALLQDDWTCPISVSLGIFFLFAERNTPVLYSGDKI